MPKIWLITGVSRDLGKVLAHAVLDRGDIVINTTRNGKTDALQRTRATIQSMTTALNAWGQCPKAQTFKRLKFYKFL